MSRAGNLPAVDPTDGRQIEGATPFEIDRNGLEVLDRRECLRLLATVSLGRIAVTFGALPAIMPVNFRLVGGYIVFRTSAGTKLAAAAANAVVAFEVDQVDTFAHAGWSVLVTGTAREVVDPTERAELERAHIPRWAPSGVDHFVALDTRLISGRRIVPGLHAHHKEGS